jgi:hypothetical protein
MKSWIVNEVEKLRPDLGLIIKKQKQLKNITMKAMRFKKKFLAVLQ